MREQIASKKFCG